MRKLEMQGLCYSKLTINEKLCLKTEAMKIHGKRIHYRKPNYLDRLNELQIWSILSNYKDLT